MPTIRNLDIDGTVYDFPSEVYFVTNEGYSQHTPFVFAGKKAGIYVLNLNSSVNVDNYFSYLSGTNGAPVRSNPNIIVIPADISDDETDYSDGDVLGYCYNIVSRLANATFRQEAIKFVFASNYIHRLNTTSVSFVEKTVVDLSTDQTITSKKTFTTLPESSVAPTTANQLVNKTYVDALMPTISTTTNIWDLTQGIYKVNNGVVLNYSSSRSITTGSYGDILIVSKPESNKVPFYMLGRSVKATESTNTIVVGVAQNNSYGVCDTYSLSELDGVVHTYNNQTINGVKTFNDLPESSVVPTTDNQLVNKKYVDDHSGGGGGGSVNWGSIGGTLSNQADLANALAAKPEIKLLPKSQAAYYSDYFTNLDWSSGVSAGIYMLYDTQQAVRVKYANSNYNYAYNSNDFGDRVIYVPKDIPAYTDQTYQDGDVLAIVYYIGKSASTSAAGNFYSSVDYRTKVISYDSSQTSLSCLKSTEYSVGNLGSWVDALSDTEIRSKFTFTQKLPESSLVPTTDDQLVNKKYVDDHSGGGSSTDVQINGTSIVSSGVANIITNTAYNSSTNKIATMSDLSSYVEPCTNNDIDGLFTSGGGE